MSVKAVNKKQNINRDEKPRLEATTVWDFPRQGYGKTPKGSNKYPGVTPALLIYNLVQRYTEPGDLVVDPMAGSGTTLDVCKEEGRMCLAYELVPPREDILQGDARCIPLPNDSVDMVFIDPPYSDNILYNDHPDNIGRLSAESEEFYDELEKVAKECHRILKPGKIFSCLIADQWIQKKFTPTGFNLFTRLCKYFEPVDIICVVYKNCACYKPYWFTNAVRYNFFVRGFRYLFIMRKASPDASPPKRVIRWTRYERTLNTTKKGREKGKVQDTLESNQTGDTYAQSV